MRTLTRFSFGVLMIGLRAVSSAGAQTRVTVRMVPATAFISCEQDPPAEDAYNYCALRFEHGRLKRGALGTELDRAQFFRPVALSRYVRGDSALIYASRYEREARWGSRLMVVAESGIFHGIMLARSRHCPDPFCTQHDLNQRSNLFLIGGGTIMAVGIDYFVHGVKAMNRALWWSNSTLPRQDK
jgi:hypothetical protein